MILKISPRWAGMLLSICGPLMLTLPASAAWKKAGKGMVLDDKTGTRWQGSDNGADISWVDAMTYCRNLSGGWRLPTVEELGILSSAAAGDAGKNLPTFKLSGDWFWSAAPLTENDSQDFKQLAWGVSLANGRKTMAFRLADFRSRALCIDATPIHPTPGANQ